MIHPLLSQTLPSTLELLSWRLRYIFHCCHFSPMCGMLYARSLVLLYSMFTDMTVAPRVTSFLASVYVCWRGVSKFISTKRGRFSETTLQLIGVSELSFLKADLLYEVTSWNASLQSFSRQRTCPFGVYSIRSSSDGLPPFLFLHQFFVCQTVMAPSGGLCIM